VGIGLTVIASDEAIPLPQALVPLTLILPDIAVFEKLTVIELVLAPAVIVAPVGKVQLYPVAFVMAGTV